MANGKGNVHLTSLDDLFTTQEQRDDAQREKVIDIPLNEIHDFPNHPFRVVQDDAMNEMAESVKQFGVLVPAMVRPADGGYELISGHRRKMASTLAGRDSLPCIVRDLSDDEAIIVMVDSNLQREQLLPSEKAKAYKMKLEAMKRQGKRVDLTLPQVAVKPDDPTCAQVGHKLVNPKSRDILAEQVGDSKSQIQRFIRLNNLVPEIMALVDEGKIGMTPAVELSYIPQEQQALVMEAIDSEQATPSLSQAQRLRKMSTAGELNEDTALEVMMEQKKPPQSEKSPLKGGITISEDRLKTIFPKTWDRVRMEKLIYSLLETWAKHREERNKGPER